MATYELCTLQHAEGKVYRMLQRAPMEDAVDGHSRSGGETNCLAVDRTRAHSSYPNIPIKRDRACLRIRLVHGRQPVAFAYRGR